MCKRHLGHLNLHTFHDVNNNMQVCMCVIVNATHNCHLANGCCRLQANKQIGMYCIYVCVPLVEVGNGIWTPLFCNTAVSALVNFHNGVQFIRCESISGLKYLKTNILCHVEIYCVGVRKIVEDLNISYRSSQPFQLMSYV